MAGISGANVQFKLSDGTLVAEGLTDGSGNYSIQVPPGTYVVNVVYPSDPGYVQVFDHVVVSDPNPSNNGSSFPVTGVDVVAGSTTTISVYSNRTVSASNQPPVASNGSIEVNRSEDYTTTKTFSITNFSYVDPEGDIPTYFKIITLPTSGTLKYNGSACTANQEISLTAGAFPNSLVYEPNQSTFTAYNVTLQWQIKCANNSSYSNSATLTIINSAFNSTTINPYLSYTSAALKSRADIPDSTHIVDNGATDVCWALLPSQAASAITSTATTWADLFALAIGTGESNKINKWSYFSPTEWYVSGGALTTRKKSVADYRATFAGYNHGAQPSSLLTHSTTMVENLGDPGTFATVYMSEIDWTTISGISKIGIRTFQGSTLLGATYYSIAAPAYMTNGVMALDNNLSLNYSSIVTLTTDIVFCNSSNVRICDVPEIGTFNTTYYPIATEMNFIGADYDYQTKVIYSLNDEWTIVSSPAWVNLHVYRGTYEVTGGNPFLRGDTLRVSVDENTGANRTGTIELSEGIEITVNQQGGLPTYTFQPDSPIVLSSTPGDNVATVAVNATSVPFDFKIVSGLGSTLVDITVQLVKLGYGALGTQAVKTTKDGLYVHGTLSGWTNTDIQYGDSFEIIISTFA